MDFKVCSKCNKKKQPFCFNWKNKKKKKRHSFCKECHSAYRIMHYLDNRKKYLIKARRWNKKQTILLRNLITKYLTAHPCVDCGETDLRVLDFDHEDKKKMGICQMIRNCYSTRAVMSEIVVCKIRCANCHRIKTFKKGNYWKEKIGP